MFTINSKQIEATGQQNSMNNFHTTTPISLTRRFGIRCAFCFAASVSVLTSQNIHHNYYCVLYKIKFTGIHSENMGLIQTFKNSCDKTNTSNSMNLIHVDYFSAAFRLQLNDLLACAIILRSQTKITIDSLQLRVMVVPRRNTSANAKI